ncbi:MAG: ATP-dependent RNA helicase HrpA [Bifidobacteriaceae bacterium]|jgi:ATP-dependent helicase HrpA|nr:ATP-dependent RNA helicase HrpA [Bifidobacteriaceae bacterium]
MAPVRITFPPELPISARREEIARAIQANQVVIVSGETGSGKTTQLPKILLELGYGRGSSQTPDAVRSPNAQTPRSRDRRDRSAGPKSGMIAHTQPRRIAARATAERISEELGTPLGQTVGYQVRFTDHSSSATRLKVMTDGVLLAQIQRDPQLRAYDAIIIDEAHERSLNIDFLLGYLSNLLPRRPDLKLVITSATIDSELFAAHFGPREGQPAPVVQVSGRTYPVEIRYRPPGENGVPEDQPTAIAAAARELMRQGDGDMLVFCSGEREIRDAADVLAGELGPRVEVLPLYSRLSAADQHRVFQRHSARRIVLATNVAETSLTVPGIHYVIDPGTARISRYSKATKVQRLPIEPISQASANQRAGRCGRIAKGICIRLYSSDDYESRPQFTDPEILRTSLASVILQMLAVGVVSSPGEVVSFPFVQPPDTRAVTDGVRLLQELGAIEEQGGRTRLTEIGRQLARIPLDPRLARMIVQAKALGVEREVTIVAAALTIQDPRERPLEFRAQADQSHARFTDPTSDFLTFLNLWEYLRSARRANSSSAFRRLVRREYLNYLRIREWQDLVKELERAVRGAQPKNQRPAGSAHPTNTRPAPGPPSRAAGDNSRSEPAADRSEHDQPPRDQPTRYPDAAEAAARDNSRTQPAPGHSEHGRHGRGETTRNPNAGGAAAGDNSSPQPAAGRPEHGGPGHDELPRDPDAADAAARDNSRTQPAPGRSEHSPSAHGEPLRNPDAGGALGQSVASASGNAESVADSSGKAFRLEWPADSIHRALLQGLLSQIGMKQVTPVRAKGAPTRAAARGGAARSAEYLGARGIKFAIFPGSALRRGQPDWVMAAELVETSRLWARVCAAIKPEWVEQAAPGLARRTYAEPRWSAKRGAAVINEKVLVYGLPVVAARPVLLSRVDPALARELFIRHALVEGDWRSRHEFDRRNRELLERAEELAARSRQSGLVFTDQDLFDFYDRRLPEQATSARHFESWWKKARAKDPERLTITPDKLEQAIEPTQAGFPDEWAQGDLVFPITYEYAPGSPHDGVTVHIPIRHAAQARPDGFDWQVPGLRLDLVAGLIRTLPKPLRAELLPAQATARRALEQLGGPADHETGDGRAQPLTEALTGLFRESRGLYIPPEAWHPEALPDHLKITFQIEDPKGRVMVRSHSLAAAQAEVAPQVNAAIERVAAATLTPSAPRPADPLATELADTAPTAAQLAAAVREQLLQGLALPSQRLTSRLRPEEALPLAASRYPTVADLTLDVQRAVIQAALDRAGVPDDQAAYEKLRAELRDRLEDEAYGALKTASGIIAKAGRIEADAARVADLQVLKSVMDVKDHLARLTGAGFIGRAGLGRLPDLRRYLDAEAHRLAKLGANRAREDQALWELGELDREVAAATNVPPEVPWMIEELRVSLFAQQLGTAYPISAKRVRRALAGAA